MILILAAASASYGELPMTIAARGRRPPSRLSAALKMSGCGFERLGIVGRRFRRQGRHPLLISLYVG